MPLPSQIASGRTTFRDFLIDFTPTQRDFDYYSAWCQTNPSSDIEHLRDCIAASWKVSITPSGNDSLPYLSLTCKRPGAYLQGFTISPKGIGLEHCFSFSAWLVLSVAALLADDVDGFLTYGSGWTSNVDPKAEKLASDEEIPF